jgi:hypothetical protein
MGREPQVLAYHGDRISKGRLEFAIPHSLPHWQRVLLCQLARPQCDEREEPQQGGGGAERLTVGGYTSPLMCVRI